MPIAVLQHKSNATAISIVTDSCRNFRAGRWTILHNFSQSTTTAVRRRDNPFFITTRLDPYYADDGSLRLIPSRYFESRRSCRVGSAVLAGQQHRRSRMIFSVKTFLTSALLWTGSPPRWLMRVIGRPS